MFEFVRDPWFFWPSLLLLWFPRQWLKALPLVKPRPMVRGSRSGLPGTDGDGMGGTFSDPHSWLDFARAAVGSYAFWQVGFSLEFLDPSMRGPVGAHVVCLVFAVGVLIQMLRPSESGNRKFFAPVLFSLGLLFGQYTLDLAVVEQVGGIQGLMRGALGIVIGGVVVLLVVAVRFLFETPYAFYVVLAMAHTGVTTALTGVGNQRIFAMAWLAMLPVAITFMFRAELTYQYDTPRRFSRMKRVPAPKK